MQIKAPLAPQPHRSLSLRLALLACAMFGFGYLLVPMYYTLCAITGIGTRVSQAVAAPVEAQIDASRVITVQFVTSVNEYAPWEFRPALGSVRIHPGEITEARFFARNLTDRKLIAQAVPNIVPNEGARHLHKLECFCFKTQDFAPHEGRDLTVRFYVDPALPAYVDDVTLSYTLFDTHLAASTDPTKARS